MTEKTARSFHPAVLLAGDGSPISAEEITEHARNVGAALRTKIIDAHAKSQADAIAALIAEIAMHQMDALYVANAAARLRIRVESVEEQLAQMKGGKPS